MFTIIAGGHGVRNDASAVVRRWSWRVLFLAWIGLTLYLSYYRWGIRLLLQAELLMCQRECMSFVEPADYVVFEGNTPQLASRLKEAGYQGARTPLDIPDFTESGAPPEPPHAPKPPTAAFSTRADGPLRRLGEVIERFQVWNELRNGAAPPAVVRVYPGESSSPDAIFPIFLHERSANGSAILVCLRASWYAGADLLDFDATVTTPAGLFGLPSEHAAPLVDDSGASASVRLNEQSSGKWCRLFAGQPNPSDSAKFTWDYETPDGRGTMQGTLRPDHQIEIRILSGPAATVSP